MTNTQSLLLVAVCVIAVVSIGGLLYFTWWIAGRVDKQERQIERLKGMYNYTKRVTNEQIEALKLETAHLQNQINELQK